MEHARFPILEQAHGIDTGTSMLVSLSIAIGALGGASAVMGTAYHPPTSGANGGQCAQRME